MPIGRSIIDFARSDPPAFYWNATDDPDTIMRISFSGADVAHETTGITVVCYTEDDGEFRPPTSYLNQLAPGSVTIGIERRQIEILDYPEFTGGGYVSSATALQLTDEHDAGIPMVYTVE